MTTRQGIDYSWARPGAAAIKAAGKEFVIRYCPYAGDTGKGLAADELADLRANGLAVGLVFESTAARALEGYEAGRADANTALDAARRLGFPDTVPIYFAVDFDAQPKDYALIDAYLKGAEWVLGPARVGVYGSYAVIDHCHAVGSARWLWQTYAWSGGKKHPAMHLYQYQNGQVLNGGEVDYCEAYGDNVGLWEPEEEDELSDADKARLDRLERLIGGFGIVVDGERLSGEDALKKADELQWSAFLGIGQLRDGLAALPATSGPVAPHKHEMNVAIAKTGPVTSS